MCSPPNRVRATQRKTEPKTGLMACDYLWIPVAVVDDAGVRGRESDTHPARPSREQHHQHVAIGGLEAVDLLCVRICSTECRREIPVSNWEIGEWTQQRGCTFSEGLLGGGSYNNFARHDRDTRPHKNLDL